MGKYIDEKGNQYERLYVICDAGRTDRGQAQWLCQCSCGEFAIIGGAQLRSGWTKSCGCLKRELTTNRQIKNLINKRFGYLLVKGFVRIENHKAYWNVVCDCGNEKVVNSYLLTSGKTRSCGCLFNSMINGDTNPNWKGGKCSERELDMSSSKYKRWRQSVYERDNYTCQLCGSSISGELRAHHLWRWADYDFIRHETWNGITLCKKCHEIVTGKEIKFAKRFFDMNIIKDNKLSMEKKIGYKRI